MDIEIISIGLSRLLKFCNVELPLVTSTFPSHSAYSHFRRSWRKRVNVATSQPQILG